MKILHFNTLKQVYWLPKPRQGQESFIFLVERATIDTKNHKLNVIYPMNQFYPLNGFILQLKFEPNTNFLEKKKLVVFCFLFLLNCNFNPTFYFFWNNTYLIGLVVFFFYIFEIVTNFLNPLNIYRWLDCNWLTNKFVHNLCSLINLAWIFYFLHVTNFFLVAENFTL